MFNKIDISKILKDHISTLTNFRTGQPYFPDFFLFFILPALLSYLIISFGILLDKDIVNILITALSVFTGLLFNLLLLVFDIVDKIDTTKQKEDPETGRHKQELRVILREIYINISFCILLSMTTIIILLISFINIKFELYLKYLSFFVYYPLLIFILTLFMVLKRIYILLSKRFENKF